MAIPKAVIDLIEEQTDIVDLVGSYVRLERRGDKFWGCCPFHGEKTPSFTVTPARHMYYCFGCHKGGGVFQFLMEIENISFVEAAERLAAKNGIVLDKANSAQLDHQQKKKAALLELYQKVQGIFSYLLWNSSEGEGVLDYVTKRGLSEETIKTFGLGYTHHDGRWLYKFLNKKGYSEEFLSESGLFSKKTYDYTIFRDRLSFPVMNFNGETIAFSCRNLPGSGSDSPKYINSPETLIYSKKNTLFGLYQAKEAMKNEKSFILCEGTMDVCAMHQMGYAHTLAPLGAAFTEGQAKLLKRYADKALLLFDADEAGQKAIMRAAVICEKEEIESKAVKINSGKDPSDILEKKEEYLLTNNINNARLSFDFLLTETLVNEKKGDPQGLERVCKVIFPYISAIISAVKREAYLKSLASRLGLSEESIQEEYKRFNKTERHYTVTAPKDIPPSVVRKVSPPVAGGPLFELLTAFLVRPDLYIRYQGEWSDEFITDERLNPVINYIKQTKEESNLFTLLDTGLLDENLKNYFLKKAATEDVVSWDERAQRSLIRLKTTILEKKRNELTVKLAQAEQENKDDEVLKTLLTERTSIVRQLNEIKAGL